jgi:hypothetical protein
MRIGPRSAIVCATRRLSSYGLRANAFCQAETGRYERAESLDDITVLGPLSMELLMLYSCGSQTSVAGYTRLGPSHRMRAYIAIARWYRSMRWIPSCCRCSCALLRFRSERRFSRRPCRRGSSVCCATPSLAIGVVTLPASCTVTHFERTSIACGCGPRVESARLPSAPTLDHRLKKGRCSPWSRTGAPGSGFPAFAGRHGEYRGHCRGAHAAVIATSCSSASSPSQRCRHSSSCSRRRGLER